MTIHTLGVVGICLHITSGEHLLSMHGRARMCSTEKIQYTCCSLHMVAFEHCCLAAAMVAAKQLTGTRLA